ncbi:hypothetical protein PTKIN_Ptkin16aG0019500 [Pterospermum kingtungense]
MVAEAAVFSLVGALASPFLKTLLDKLDDGSLINMFRRTKLKDDLLLKMEISLLAVEKVFDAAEEKQFVDPFVKGWMEKLKDAVYDADDLLDAIETEGQENEAKDFNTRLEKIVSKLEVIAKEKDILNLKEGQGWNPIPRLPSTSLIDESEACFRLDDKNQLLDSLLSDHGVNRKGVPVVAIVGMGGIGKTTLAQFLYNAERVKGVFDLRAWVYVSEEFDIFKVTKTIYEYATSLRTDIEDLNMLQVTLQTKLKGRRFLLVLDNVWNVRFSEWDLLRRPLQAGAAGSKIIVTTRNQGVSSTIPGVLVHDLKKLPEEDCWSLFAKHAFGDRDPEEDSNLKRIGKQIVKKCEGLPLAIKTLGSLLHSEVELEEWNNVLNSRIWDLPDHKSDILPALRLSYLYLPSVLKRCFAYCSIFPKGHKIEKGELVRMWIAEGFVQQPNGRRTREEVGEQYIHELLSRSIFQQSDRDQSRFIMHDLISDLAQHIAGDFCFKFEDDIPPQNPARVRHLSCILKPSDTLDKFEAFYGKNKALRTFLPLRKQGEKKPLLNPGLLTRLLSMPSCLRVLSLSSYRITEFPQSVEKLKQLRYLDFSGAEIIRLPERVGHLYNLQTLKLSDCSTLGHLQAKLSNLTKLEHLDMKGTSITMLPDSIDSLKQLGYLDLSETKIVGLPEGLCSLYNLQTLKLSGCRELKPPLPTDMKNLTKLKHLDMKGTPILELPESIGHLKQLGYLDLSGTPIQRLPEEVCSLYNLQTLKLSHCHELTCLPTDMKNLTNLKHLDIEGTPAIQRMPPNFGNLKSLQLLTTFVVGNDRLSTISELKDLSLLCGTLSILRLQNVSQTADAEEANLKDKKYIRGLIFEWDIADPCNGNAQNAASEPRNRNATVGPSNANLKNAANVPRNRDIKIVAENHHNGNTQNEHSAKSGDDHAANVLDKLQPSENLESLKIKNFLGTGLPNWLGDTSFCKMKSLTLENCRNCSSLPPLGQLPFLQELYIWDMVGVKTVGSEFYGTDGVGAFKSLEYLQFERMDNWEEWSSSINGGFPSLEVLILKECRKLAGLPTHLFPSNLEIEQHDCDKLQHQGTTKITLQQLLRTPQPQSS